MNLTISINGPHERATGTRIGNVGKRPLPPNVVSAAYEAPPEGVSFTFDDDGYCRRLTAAVVLDPLLGNTGGLGGVYGLLYATGTPASALRTRSANGILNRAVKGLLSGVTGVRPDGWRLSDGRTVGGRGPSLPGGSWADVISLPSAASSGRGATAAAWLPPKSSLPAVAATPKPLFAAAAIAQQQQKPAIALPAVLLPPQRPKIPIDVASPLPISDSPTDPVTEALRSAFGINSANCSVVDEPASPAFAIPPSSGIDARVQQLRDSARAARAEAVEAREKAEARKALDAAENKALVDAMLEKQKQDVLKRQQSVEEAPKKADTQPSERPQTTKLKATTQPSASDANSSKAGTAGGVFSFLKSGGLLSRSSPTLAATIPTSASARADRAPPRKAQPTPAASPSPTISVFADPFKSSMSSSPNAKTPVTKESVVRSLPTSSLLGSSPTKAKPSSVKTSAISKAKGLSKTTPKSNGRAATLKIVGVGGASQLAVGSKKPSTYYSETKPIVMKAIATTKSPTINLLQKSVKKSKAAATKSPTLNLFGGGRVGGDGTAKKEQPVSATVKSAATKSPTLNLFGGGRVGDGTAKKEKPASVTVEAVATKSPTLNLFGGGRVGDGTAKKEQPASATVKAVATKSPTLNLFGGGRVGDGTAKKEQPASVTPTQTSGKKPIVLKVPLLVSYHC